MRVTDNHVTVNSTTRRLELTAPYVRHTIDTRKLYNLFYIIPSSWLNCVNPIIEMLLFILTVLHWGVDHVCIHSFVCVCFGVCLNVTVGTIFYYFFISCNVHFCMLPVLSGRCPLASYFTFSLINNVLYT